MLLSESVRRFDQLLAALSCTAMEVVPPKAKTKSENPANLRASRTSGSMRPFASRIPFCGMTIDRRIFRQADFIEVAVDNVINLYVKVAGY